MDASHSSMSVDLNESDSLDDEEGEERPKHKGFLEGGKAASFARAFAKAMNPGKGEQTILRGNKAVIKKRAEDKEETTKDKEAKRARLELRTRGHVLPKPKGDDPEADIRERGFQKTATRGVVKLFNAVAKAQKQLRETQELTGNRLKAAKVSKASFLSEIRAGQKTRTKENKIIHSVAEEPGWEVLQDGFAGLQGGSKMKDWDRKQDEEVDDELRSDSSDVE